MSEQPGHFVVAEIVEVPESARIEDQSGPIPPPQVGYFAVEDAMIPDVVGTVNRAFELHQSIFDQRKTRAAEVAR